ncbi:MAG: hypothetical protein J3K34DRAFT_518175 [Monoraphidium minutum]|nr:MAG: hypothetical protein J3K34DRAFT_518175 [Monoraphidium minutum]
MASGGESMRPYLRMQNLFVRDIDPTLPREAVIVELTRYCGPAQGRIVVPTSDTTGGVLGIAYLNYMSSSEAARVLERLRFTMAVAGKPVRIMYAVEPRFREHLFGPFGLRFQAVVKNLSPELDEVTLYERFARHGEVYQLRLDTDDYGRRSGVVHYLDEASVHKAIQAENGQLFCNTRIAVEPHSRLMSGGGAAHAGPPPSAGSFQDFPSLPGSRAQPPPPPPSGGGGPTAAAQPPPPARPQQQPAQEQPVQQQPPPPPPPPQQQQQQQQQPAPPPQQQQQQQQQQPDSPGLPAHLSLMLDRQTESFGAGPSGAAPASPPRPPGAAPQQQQQQQQQQQSSALQFDMLSGLGDLELAERAAAATSPAAAPARAQMGGPLAPPTLNGGLGAGGRAAVLGYPAAGGGGGGGGLHLGHAARRGSLGGQAGGAASVRGLAKQLVGRLDLLTELLCCPITQEPFRDPVVASDGQTYERAAILSWMSSSETSPLTHQPLVRGALMPNKLIRAIVDELALLV